MKRFIILFCQRQIPRQRRGGHLWWTGLIILVFLVLIWIHGTSLSLAEIPKMINYQGMLTNESGDPITDTLDLEFGIYTQETGGTPEWSEAQNQVSIIDGLFNVILGSVDPNGVNLDFSEPYWLEVQVDNDTMPRLRFTSVGYAYRALVADSAMTATPGSGSNWSVSNSVLYTNEYWGIARGGAGNVLYGDSAHTMVNFGVACTTGSEGEATYYSTVSGGSGNIADESWSTVVGGEANKATNEYATIGGGWANAAGGMYSTIGGGRGNTTTYTYSTVGGGRFNKAIYHYATVGGGGQNTADSNYSTVGGGYLNTASGYYATVGGGYQNTASYDYATVGGGYDNTANSNRATVGGGDGNTAWGNRATVGGGKDNSAGGWYGTIGGGKENSTTGYAATVGGGESNTTSGEYATVPGGRLNTAAGNYSFAAGRRAKANHHGTFVWADSTDADFASTGDNQFLVRASGGVGIGTDSPTEKLDVDGTARLRGITTGGSGTIGVEVDANGVLWKVSPSSKRYKKNIRRLQIDPEEVLKLQTVRFEWKTTGKEDVGLIAEDVEEAVPDLVIYNGEGEPEAVKYDKVAIYLLEVVKAQEERISALEKEIAQLRK